MAVAARCAQAVALAAACLILLTGCAEDGTPQFSLVASDGSERAASAAWQEPESHAGPSAAEGLTMYRNGLRPNGEPLTALVAGDVPVTGAQFSCTSCHGRSGMGVAEGAYVVPPIAGQFLFEESPQPARPAYTTGTLARVLREGVTPSGRQLGELMPRYVLDDNEVASLSAYLASLSSRNSPGVDDEKMYFATVVSESVPDAERQAVLSVLRQWFDEHNRQTRLESERWDRGYTPESRLPTIYREWVLEEWTLEGSPESWSAQLEQRYAERPVFAMVSGLIDESWRPIGAFCETNEIPCLFPGANQPDAAQGDFFTLYFSGGLDLEAEVVAARLAASQASSVFQFYCRHESNHPATRLNAALSHQGVVTKVVPLDCSLPLKPAKIIEVLAGSDQAALVLWLDRFRLGELAGLDHDGPIYFSSIMIDANFDDPLPDLGPSTYAAHTLRLPGASDPAYLRFSIWAKSRGIELTSAQRQAEAYFAGMALKNAAKHMRRFFIRDYVLDMLDHAQGLAAYVPFHARPTFGPGQRFLNKGGYIVPIVDGRPDAAAAEWVAP